MTVENRPISQVEEQLREAQQLLARQQVPQAEQLLLEVLKQDANNQEALGGLVMICLQSGRAEEAQQHLQCLVATYPENELYCERLATLLVSRGEADKAIAAYRTLLAGSPQRSNSRYNLARLLKRTGYPDQALVEYEECLQRSIDCPEEVLTNISVIHTEAHHNDRAEAALRRALSINMDYVPALYNLALLQEEMGDWSAAHAQLVNILALQPLHAGALSHIAAAQTITDPVDPLLRSMKRAERQDGVTEEDRESLLYALGKANDDLQRFSDAFEFYMRANQYSRGRAGEYDRGDTEQAVSALIEGCNPPWLNAIEPVSDAPLLFICGMFRSGSTLLEQILAAHPRVTAGGEIDYLRSRLAPFPATVLDIENDAAQKLGHGYLDYLQQNFGDTTLVCNKRPDNFLYLGLIKALFPNARFLNTSRDPMDVCLSVFFQSLDKSLDYANDLFDIAHYYLQYQRLMSHWRQLFGDNILDVSYESLVENLQPEITVALEFLGLEWDPACLEFHASDSRVRTASLHQVRQPLYQSSAGRWHNYAAHIGKLEGYLK